MKKQILAVAASAIFSFAQAQDIPSGQVPSVVLSSFSTDFPKAQDVEWEMEGNLYVVDFETGWNLDHEGWYNAKGELVKHEEDIAPKDLPKTVSDRINKDFGSYTLDDLQRIENGDEVVYQMELNALMQQDYDVVIDSSGNVVSQIAD